MIAKERVIELANKRIEELDNNTYLVDVTVSPSNQILVEVDNLLGSAGISDCVSISRNIEHNLDREVEDFELQVTSPGLDRPFKVGQQYQKNLGKQVKVVFQGHGSIEGELKDYDGNNIWIETTSKQRVEGKKKKEIVSELHEVPMDKVKETKIVIKF